MTIRATNHPSKTEEPVNISTGQNKHDYSTDPVKNIAYSKDEHFDDIARKTLSNNVNPKELESSRR